MTSNLKKPGIGKLLVQAGKSFANDKAMKFSASLSYYTIFAIGPLLLLIITLTSIFVSEETVSQLLTGQLQSLLGSSAAEQITSILANLKQQQTNAKFFGLVGGITLFVTATGVFLEIQDSINYIWCIQPKPKKGWLRFITNRLLSFSLIVGIGFLLLVSLLINTLTDLLMQRLERFLGGSETILLQGLNLLVLFTIVTLLFSVIYKVLPDAKIHWRDTLIGAGFTGILFLLGKFGIGLYLGNSQVANTYGAAASVIVILLWVYYSAIILYFGAEFTKEWAMSRGRGITPDDTAVLIEKTEVKELTGKKHAGPDEIPVEIR